MNFRKIGTIHTIWLAPANWVNVILVSALLPAINQYSWWEDSRSVDSGTPGWSYSGYQTSPGLKTPGGWYSRCVRPGDIVCVERRHLRNMVGNCKLGSSKMSSTSIHGYTKTTKTNASTILYPPMLCFCAKSQRFQVNNPISPLLIRANSWLFCAWCSKAFLFGSGRFFISYTKCTKNTKFLPLAKLHKKTSHFG